MNFKEFNERYKVTVKVEAIQKVEAIGSSPFEYGSIEDILDNVDYEVSDRETGEFVLQYEGSSEEGFLEELKEELGLEID